MVFESGRPIAAHVAADLGVHPEALRKRVRQAEADGRAACAACCRSDDRRVAWSSARVARAGPAAATCRVRLERSNTRSGWSADVGVDLMSEPTGDVSLRTFGIGRRWPRRGVTACLLRGPLLGLLSPAAK